VNGTGVAVNPNCSLAIDHTNTPPSPNPSAQNVPASSTAANSTFAPADARFMLKGSKSLSPISGISVLQTTAMPSNPTETFTSPEADVASKQTSA
jgi:hypothetical protein